jgi:hypothetical protein
MDQMLRTDNESTEGPRPFPASQDFFLFAEVLIPLEAIRTGAAKGMGFHHHAIPSVNLFYLIANPGNPSRQFVTEDDGRDPIFVDSLKSGDFRTADADLFNGDQDVTRIQVGRGPILHVESVRLVQNGKFHKGCLFCSSLAL